MSRPRAGALAALLGAVLAAAPACQRRAAAPNPAPPAADALSPPPPAGAPLPPGLPPEAGALAPLLAARDAAPTLCADLATRVPDDALRVAALAALAEALAAPPWAAVRAADCLARHDGPRAAPHLLRWAPAPQHLGLTLAALQHLDALPLPLAQDLARAAWADGAAPPPVRTAILRSQRPEIRAVVEPPPPTGSAP